MPDDVWMAEPSLAGERAPRRARHLIVAGAVVLAVLMAFVILTSVDNTRLSDDADRAGDDAARYGPIIGLVGEQHRLIHDYTADPAGATAKFEAVDRRTDALLASLVEDGGGEVERLARTEAAHHRAMRSYFAARDAGDTERAERIEQRLVEPNFERTLMLAQRNVDASAEAADDATEKLARRQDFNLVMLPLAFLLGGALLILLLLRGRRIELRQAEAQAEIKVLEREALTDSLTGLGNHRAFHDELGREVRLSQAAGTPLCALMLDMDGLKAVNDRLGHQVGDSMLRSLAAQLREATADHGRAFRLGGDEFAVVLRGVGTLDGAELAERVRDRLTAEDETIDVAVGVAETAGLESQTELTRRADVAMMHAKRTNRHIVVYSADVERGESRLGDPEDKYPRHALASALARAVDAKDSYTQSHSEMVSTICVLVADELGLAPDRVAKLRMAGLLHDVGQIGTPDRILQKPAKLSDDEYAVIQQHPVKGAEIARAAGLEEESEWILHHHERIDGDGYPDGLAGEVIPLESRIILVADAYEALIADRPYRRGRPAAEALEEIERHAGTQFDPHCVAALRAVLTHEDPRRPGSRQGAEAARPTWRAAPDGSPAAA
jgi:diguanylate cyclase (GGDEF)-like protein/putative nucleotidyltransferase with HDIG domain